MQVFNKQVQILPVAYVLLATRDKELKDPERWNTLGFVFFFFFFNFKNVLIQIIVVCETKIIY